jgi:hypothetical protein
MEAEHDRNLPNQPFVILSELTRVVKEPYWSALWTGGS